MSRISEAREKYRPENIKLMFIAEAPPSAEERFFYYEDLTKGDSLFLYVIRSVFPDLKNESVPLLRAKKAELLKRFMLEGYFLEDAVAFPILQGTRSRDKISTIERSFTSLNKRIEKYKDTTKMVLISSTVFSAINSKMKYREYYVLNKTAIPFPGSGQQKRFEEEIAKIEL